MASQIICEKKFVLEKHHSNDRRQALKLLCEELEESMKIQAALLSRVQSDLEVMSTCYFTCCVIYSVQYGTVYKFLDMHMRRL